jgi:hypothetical protein
MNLTKADALQDEVVRDLFQPVAWWGEKPYSSTEQTYIETSRSVEDDHVRFYRDI